MLLFPNNAWDFPTNIKHSLKPLGFFLNNTILRYLKKIQTRKQPIPLLQYIIHFLHLQHIQAIYISNIYLYLIEVIILLILY